MHYDILLLYIHSGNGKEIAVAYPLVTAYVLTFIFYQVGHLFV